MPPAPSPAPTSLPRALFSILLIWLIGLGAAAQFAKIAVPFAALAALYPEGGTQVSWLLTLISLLGAGLGMVAGGWVARIGCQRALFWALLLAGVMSLAQASLPGFALMALSRIIEGLSHLALVIAAPTLMAEVSPPRLRGAALTLWSTFFGVSFALTAWIAPPVLAQHGLAMLFAGHGVYMLAMALLALLVLGRQQALPQARPLAGIGLGQRFRIAFGAPHIAAPGLGWLFYTLTFVSLLTLLPDLLEGDATTLVGTVLPLVSILCALVLVPPLLWRFSAVSVTVAGFLLAALCVLLPLTGLTLAWAGVALFAVLGLVQGASFAAVPELTHTQEDRALANGVLAQMGNIGNLLGTPLLIFLLAQTGLQATLGFVALLYLGGALCHLWFARQRRRQAQRAASG